MLTAAKDETQKDAKAPLLPRIDMVPLHIFVKVIRMSTHPLSETTCFIQNPHIIEVLFSLPPPFQSYV